MAVLGSKGLRVPVDYCVFVGGVSLAGRVTKFEHPDLEWATEIANLAGILGSTTIRLDLKELKAKLGLKDVNRTMMALFGREKDIPIVIRAAARAVDDSVDPLKITLMGKVNKLSSGAWEPGKAADQSYEIDLDYYKYEDNGEVVYEIDKFNGVLIVDGVDIWRDMRAALGQ